RELREQLLDRLGDPRTSGHAPVLASPVEPAAGQLLDGLVQVLVEPKVEDELGLARIVREQPDLPGDGLRLVRCRIDGQTDELSADGGVRTGAPLRRRVARRGPRRRAPRPCRGTTALTGPSRSPLSPARSSPGCPRGPARPRCRRPPRGLAGRCRAGPRTGGSRRA